MKPRPKQNPKPVETCEIPFFDLRRQYRLIQPQVERSVAEVFSSGAFVLSPKVIEFETAFAKYANILHGIGVGSGTDALIFALKAAGVEPGDQVIVPSFTFVATVFAILHLGAIPVLADVHPRHFTLDPFATQKLITRKTKAILPVHLFGRMADMPALHEIAKKRKLKLIEDAAQAHGSTWRGNAPGALSDGACFSFYPTKNLGAFGDGGMILTQSDAMAARLRILRNLGRASHTDHVETGWTSRLDAVQAVILSVKLRYLDDFNDNRIRIAQRYRRQLQETPLLLPEELNGSRHVYHVFAVRVPGKNRDALKGWLEKRGVPTVIHYAKPVHEQVFYAPYRAKLNPAKTLPVTEMLARECLSLPIFPEMTHDEVDYVCETIQGFYRRVSKFHPHRHQPKTSA